MKAGSKVGSEFTFYGDTYEDTHSWQGNHKYKQPRFITAISIGNHTLVFSPLRVASFYSFYSRIIAPASQLQSQLAETASLKIAPKLVLKRQRIEANFNKFS